MGPDVLIGSGGAGSLTAGGNSISGLARFSVPAAQFLMNRRKWWCCGVRRRRKTSSKHSTVNVIHQLKVLDQTEYE